MEKYAARDYVSEIEERLAITLRRWKALPKILNGRIIQLNYQFEQSHIIVNIWWQDGHEIIILYMIDPYVMDKPREEIPGPFSVDTLTMLVHYLAHFAQIVESRWHE